MVIVTSTNEGRDAENVQVVGEFLNIAWRRSKESLDEARRLRDAGFPGPAFVWAVRAAEIFTREFLLMPLFLEQGEGVQRALRRARKIFGAGNWARAYTRLEKVVGPIDELLTDEGEDAWKHWKRYASDIRGNVVHGVSDSDLDEVDWAIEYFDQLFKQMTLRMIVSKVHPASDVLMTKSSPYGRSSDLMTTQRARLSSK